MLLWGRAEKRRPQPSPALHLICSEANVAPTHIPLASAGHMAKPVGHGEGEEETNNNKRRTQSTTISFLTSALKMPG